MLDRFNPADLPLPPALIGVPRLSRDGRLDHREVAEECAVALVYDGTTAAVVMAMPSDLPDLALGFGLTEGIIKSSAEIRTLEVVPGLDGGTVSLENGRFAIRAEDQIVAEIFRPSFFLDRLERSARKTLREREGFEMPWLRSLTFSRDTKPIALCAPDLRPRVLRCLHAIDPCVGGMHHRRENEDVDADFARIDAEPPTLTLSSGCRHLAPPRQARSDDGLAGKRQNPE